MGSGPSRPTFYDLCSKPFPIVFLGDDEVVHDPRELSQSGPSFPELRPHFPGIGALFQLNDCVVGSLKRGCKPIPVHMVLGFGDRCVQWRTIGIPSGSSCWAPA